MKKGLFLCLVMMVIATTLYAAGVDTGIRVKALGNKRIQVTVPAQESTTELMMIDERGRPLFNVEVKGDEYQKVIDLKNLPTGDYSIKTNNGFKLELVSIKVWENEVAFGNHQVKFLPTVVLRNQALYVNTLPNLGKVSVSIVDGENHIMCDKVIDTSKSKGQVFDFSKSPKASYTVWLSANDFETSKKININ
jgi:dipeptidyl aminopeptidase/acylaminoacyl peptidase